MNQFDEPIWETSAQAVLQFLIGYTLEALPPEDWNMMTVCELYHALIRKNGMDAFIPWTKEHRYSFPAKKLNEIMANPTADKMMASIFGFVNVALTPFDLPEAKYIFKNENAVDIRELGKKKMVLFIEVFDTDSAFDCVQNLIFTQTIQMLFQEADANEDGRLKVPVTLMMDDFAANMNIPEFDKIISVTRSRDVAISIILQILSQLTSIYGEHRAKTILNNCDTLIFMGAQDLDTAEYIGNRSGRSQEYILSMPRNMEYLIMAGQKAKLVKKLKPYQY